MNVNIVSDEESSDSGESRTVRVNISGDTLSENSTTDEQLPMDSNFDLTLPATHSYLGNNLEELRGRTILDDGIYMNLPLLVQKSVVLFPGQTLPMTAFGTQTIEMLKKCIQSDRTFGVVCLRYNKMVPIGTTAEIYEYKEGGPVQGFRLKAKGRQRFKILRVVQGYGKISANVRIVPEITLGPPFSDERLASLNCLRINPTNKHEAKKQDKVERLDATVTPWPAWVYRQYDPRRLSLKLRQCLQFIQTRGSNIPQDPTELSFWIAQNLPLDDNERIILLNYDCAIPRLQREIKYLTKDRIFVCSHCDSLIGKQSDLFPMSKEGPQNAYCNPGGVIHETITLYRAQGIALNNDPPSTECSWFPGYAWTIATCKCCNKHMGWRFTAVQSGLRPEAFWGLARGSLRSKKGQGKKRGGDDGRDCSDSDDDRVTY